MKKAISLFLVFSILALSANMFAKERRGIILLIQKKDGQYERGELIAVKRNSLLLKHYYYGTDVSVEIKDIRIITIKKKSQLLGYSGAGLLVGTSIGVLIGGSLENHSPTRTGFMKGVATAGGSIAGAAIGLVTGLVIGSSVGGIQKQGEQLQEYTSPSRLLVIIRRLRT